MLSVAARSAVGRPSRRLWMGSVLALASLLSLAIGHLRTAPPPPPAAVERMADQRSAGERAIEDAQRRLARVPEDPRTLTRLAIAYLLRQRETGDPAYYALASELLQRAHTLNPEEYETLVLLGSLAAARHEFIDALRWGEQAVAQSPERPAGYAVLVDALVELGRYEEAVAAAQRMVDLRPDQPSLTRVSYLRELYGDLDGAIDALRMAISAGAPDSEATAWSEVRLGDLLLAQGRLQEAEQAYVRSTQRQRDYAYGIAGLGKVSAASGDLDRAVELYGRAASTVPAPEVVIALGDAYQRKGDSDRAQQQYGLVRATQRLLAANGVRTDIDLALFNAEHGTDLEQALEAARSEYAWRKSVHVADALAWIEYRLGMLDDAEAHSREALRLGTRDPLMLYRAGVIAEAVGDEQRAVELLRAAAAMNAEYSVRHGPDLAR